jgi:hypothetical protein
MQERAKGSIIDVSCGSEAFLDFLAHRDGSHADRCAAFSGYLSATLE